MTTNLPATTQAAMTSGLPQLGAGPSRVFAQLPAQNDMAQGVGASFGLLTFRGKVWRIKYRGEEHALVLPPAFAGGPPAGPKPTCEVVIIKASPAISKVFYKDGYSEGDREAPDCMSTNGQAPDPASPEKQSPTCAACPQNVWGSKMMPSGKPGKACQDSKRLAIVPADDMANEMFGGPLLLRVPAASLQDMAAFSSMLQQHGYPYYGVVVSLSFDMQNAYPKLVFTAVRGLNDAEAAKVIELQGDHRVTRILSEAVDTVRHEAPPALAPPTGQQPVMPTPTPVQVPVQVPQPATVVMQQPVMQPSTVQPVLVPASPHLAAPIQTGPMVGPGGVTQAGSDNLTIPAHLVRPITSVTGQIAQPVELTQAQQIAELQAKLAALSAGQPATPPTTTRRRSRGAATAPPSPTPTEANGVGGSPVVAAPAQVTSPTPVQPATTGFLTQAQPVTGAQTVQAPAPSPMEADLDAQLDSLLSQ